MKTSNTYPSEGWGEGGSRYISKDPPRGLGETRSTGYPGNRATVKLEDRRYQMIMDQDLSSIRKQMEVAEEQIRANPRG